MSRLGAQSLSRLTRAVVFFGLLLSLFISIHLQASAEPDSYDRLSNRIKHLEKDKLTAVSEIGVSVQGRPIYVVTLTQPGKPESISADRMRVLVLSGQHGDEPIPAYTALDLLESFIRRKNDISDQNLRDVVVAFVPVVNPDGFVNETRCNSSGIDLNRDWVKCTQPETSAVMKFVREFHPHVLIDQHEWTKDDPYRPNCIETAGFGHNSNRRLARLLAVKCAKKLSANGFTLQTTHYHRQSDLSMAHRQLTESGICAMLVETSPDWPVETRRTTYKEVIETIISTLSSPPDPVTVNDISVLVSKRGSANEWIGELYSKWQVRPDHPVQSAWIFALLATAVIAVIRTATPKNSQKQSAITVPRSRYSLTEMVRSDLPMRTRLAMIHRHRQRPSDRTAHTTINR